MIFSGLPILQIPTLIIYLSIFLSMVIEGPVTTFIAASTTPISSLNIYLIFILSILGDLIGDLLVYCLGKYSNNKNRFINKISKKIKQKTPQVSKTYKYIINKKLFLFLLTIKWIPGLATANIFLVGKFKVPFYKFLPYTTSIIFIKNLIICLLGYYTIITVQTFNNIYNSYLTITLTIITAIISTFSIMFFYKKIIPIKQQITKSRKRQKNSL